MAAPIGVGVSRLVRRDHRGLPWTMAGIKWPEAVVAPFTVAILKP